MRLIAVLPARVNSRRLPNKNFKPFFRKAMLSWVLEEIEKAEIFDKVIVSTDISTVTGQHIFTGDIFKWHIRKNPAHEQTVDDVCLEVLGDYPDYDYLCCIYPTAYAVTWQDLCKSFKFMIDNLGKSCCSINMLNHENGENLDNGGLYWYRINKEKWQNMFQMELKYELPQVDINTLQDFAEAKLHAITLSCGRFKEGLNDNKPLIKHRLLKNK